MYDKDARSLRWINRMKANEAPDTLLDLYMLSCMAELHNPIRLLYQKREHRSTLTVLIRKCFLFYFGFIILVYLLSFNFCFCLFLYRVCFPRLEGLNKFCRLRGGKTAVVFTWFDSFWIQIKNFYFEKFRFYRKIEMGQDTSSALFLLKSSSERQNIHSVVLSTHKSHFLG